MKNKSIIIIMAMLVCLLAVSSYYVYDFATQNSLLESKAAAFKCPEVTACPVKSETDQESEISPVSAGPDTLGDYKVADFLDLGPKDLYMLVENENEYEHKHEHEHEHEHEHDDSDQITSDLYKLANQINIYQTNGISGGNSNMSYNYS